MNIGIVTTWFERGAAYVSRQFEETLTQQGASVFIYARGGEHYAIGDSEWDKDNVEWQKEQSFVTSYVNCKQLEKWIERNNIELIIFNEQHYWQAVIEAKKLNVKTVAYVDYYKQDTVPLFDLYDAVIVNTRRHESVFANHKKAIYIPWGTTTAEFPMQERTVEQVHFFHSCGMSHTERGQTSLLKQRVDYNVMTLKSSFTPK